MPSIVIIDIVGQLEPTCTGGKCEHRGQRQHSGKVEIHAKRAQVHVDIRIDYSEQAIAVTEQSSNSNSTESACFDAKVNRFANRTSLGSMSRISQPGSPLAHAVDLAVEHRIIQGG